MGSRLAILVREADGGYYFGKGWAQFVGARIAIDGYEKTMHDVRASGPHSIASAKEWVPGTWAEGSLFIDTPRKTVFWVGEGEEGAMPRVINALIEQTWPGWTAVWSAEQTCSTQAAAGVDDTAVFMHPSVIRDDGSLAPLEEEEAAMASPWMHDSYGYRSDAVSCRMEDGRTIAWRGDADLDFISAIGPDGMHTLAEQVAKHATAGEIPDWDDASCTDHPDLGVHLDFANRSVRWWSIMGTDCLLTDFSCLWPGWHEESCGDNAEWHAQIIGRNMRSWKSDIRKTKEFFTLLVNEHRQLHFNRPAFTDLVFTTLEKLEDGKPLPPARFVNRHGEIIEPPGNVSLAKFYTP